MPFCFHLSNFTVTNVFCLWYYSYFLSSIEASLPIQNLFICEDIFKHYIYRIYIVWKFSSFFFSFLTRFCNVLTLYLKTSFTIPMRLRLYVLHFPSSVQTLLRSLNFCTCLILIASILDKLSSIYFIFLHLIVVSSHLSLIINLLSFFLLTFLSLMWLRFYHSLHFSEQFSW